MQIIWVITFALLESFCLAQDNPTGQFSSVNDAFTGDLAVTKFLNFTNNYYTCLNQTASQGRVNITINTIGEIALHPVDPEEDWHNLKTDSDIFKCVPDTDCVVVVNDNQGMVQLDAQEYGIFHTTNPEDLKSGDFHLNEISKHTSTDIEKRDDYVLFSLFDNADCSNPHFFEQGYGDSECHVMTWNLIAKSVRMYNYGCCGGPVWIWLYPHHSCDVDGARYLLPPRGDICALRRTYSTWQQPS